MGEVTGADPGLQPQRTALAWSRTGMAVLLNAVIVLRAGLVTGHALILALGGVLLVAAGCAVACGTWRVRQLAALGADAAPSSRLIAATVWVAWFACFAGVASIVATHR